MSWARVDGHLSSLKDAVVPATDAGLLAGWTVFETLRVVDGRVPLLDDHLKRLRGSASAAEIHVPAAVREEVLDLAGRMPGEARIRVTLSGSGLRLLTISPVPRGRRGAPVRCVTGPFVADPFLAGAVKHGSRAGWVAAVRRSGADDVLMVDQEGRFTEGTTSGIVAVIDGVVVSAAHDGRILESTTVADVLSAAKRLGFPIVRVGAESTGAFDALYIASATRGLAPVVELDGHELPTWDPVGRAIFAQMP